MVQARSAVKATTGVPAVGPASESGSTATDGVAGRKRPLVTMPWAASGENATVVSACWPTSTKFAGMSRPLSGKGGDAPALTSAAGPMAPSWPRSPLRNKNLAPPTDSSTPPAGAATLGSTSHTVSAHLPFDRRTDAIAQLYDRARAPAFQMMSTCIRSDRYL